MGTSALVWTSLLLAQCMDSTGTAYRWEPLKLRLHRAVIAAEPDCRGVVDLQRAENTFLGPDGREPFTVLDSLGCRRLLHSIRDSLQWSVALEVRTQGIAWLKELQARVDACAAVDSSWFTFDEFSSGDPWPELVDFPEPIAPDSPRRGVVRVKVTIDSCGAVVHAEAEESDLPLEFEQSALVAARGARFRPFDPLWDCPSRPRSWSIMIPVRFGRY